MTGQPYNFQWFMKYFEVPIENKANDSTVTILMFKKNIFTRSVYLFTYKHPYKIDGHRWHEPGYGYGAWIKIK